MYGSSARGIELSLLGMKFDGGRGSGSVGVWTVVSWWHSKWTMPLLLHTVPHGEASSTCFMI